MPAADQPRSRRDRAADAVLRTRILNWYDASRRDLPWRGTRDPYAILVSEIMLQQTQAPRVASRFVRFMARFPDAAALADAPPAAILAEWSGLGYNRRALALQRCAAVVAAEGWPTDVAGLQRLPGVGPYTARAVASLAFDIGVGAVDTNVRRWLLRRFGGPDGSRTLQALADELAAPGRGEEIAAWTNASIELGATICRQRQPLCDACPIADGCPSQGRPSPVPVRRQAELRGSDRAVRGALLRALSAAPGNALSPRAVREKIGGELEQARWERILAGLEGEELIHRRPGSIGLGAATIAS
jgi:A/G-specific adenine glycosylase